MNRFARFELIVAFRFMRDGLMQTLLIVLGTWCVGLLIVGAVLSFPTFLLGGAAGNTGST